MKAGDLTERVTIQQVGPRTPNGQGGYTTSWQDVAGVATVWANIVGLSGAETVNETVLRSVTRWRVTIRRRADVTTAHRLRWNDLLLNIISAMPLPADPRGFTLLVCESGLSADGS